MARLVTMDNFLRQTAAGRIAGLPGSPQLPPPPTLVGFRTGRLLGIGGSASVWLVEDRRTGAERALKVISGSAACPTRPSERASHHLAQLHRESAVLGSLDHPHLLRFHGVVSTDQGKGLLTDFAGGGSLLNLVTARGRLSVGECVTVLAPIAQALAYLHGASVQHGDVSPGNVLFTAEGKPLLADLGVGRLLGEIAARGGGTEGFTDTVQATELSSGYLSDVYSLAAIGWYSLTGSPPAVVKDRVPLTLLVPEVPSELLHILEAGLREDPRDRPSAAEMAEAVLLSAEPQPLDLVAAVHPSVLPELLTRRAASEEAQNHRRHIPRWVGHRRLFRLTSRQVLPKPAPRQGGRRSARLPGRSLIKWRLVMPQVTAALLVVCGALLVAPEVLRAIGGDHDGAAPESMAPFGDSAAGDRGDSKSPAHQSGISGTKKESAGPAAGVRLSPELRERLARADPVKALSALVGVRAMVLATGDAGLLRYVNVDNSEAMDADRLLVAGLQERGHVFSGLNIRLQEAAQADAVALPEGSVAVRATAVMSGYTEMDSAGEAVRKVAESTPQDLVFVLVKNEGMWRIASVHTKDTV